MRLTKDTKIKLSQIKDLKQWIQDKHSNALPGDIRRWTDGKLHIKQKHGWTVLPNQKEYTLKTDTKKKNKKINPKHTPQSQYEDVVEKLFNKDYKNAMPRVRFPDLNRSLGKQLGVANTTQFIFAARYPHIGPERKGDEGQALREEEYKEIPKVIKNARSAYIDAEKKNFFLVFRDKQNPEMINKIVFNKTDKGNYLVTLGKVNERDEMARGKKILIKSRS